MNLYLLVLEGQGDVETKLVTENVWNWIHGPMVGKPNGKNGWPDPTTPESVQKQLRQDEPDDETGLAFVTTGSLQNDRALHAVGEEVPFDEYGGDEGPDDAGAWAKEHGHTIVGEWEGYIY
jgi:hypothetical protein